ncbi:MAG: ATP-binding protein [Planctomycetes bacterium]|nr:ATP-binding protein [Planctomycetota bacterium]
MPRSKPSPKAARVKLKPADPFDLIRLLARSQNDPRKAVCELVQNSLDAQATHIELHWLNEHGERVLRVRDDGRGVFPELEREDALRRIAQTIGHSHKRALTPEQRRELMALGKYGIGLLGFWSVAQHMSIRSRVAGGDPWVLHLETDREDAKLEKSRARRIDETPTFTEVVLRGVHEGADRQLRPGRLQAYLASELRGQLLSRDVAIHIPDHVARGLAHKHFVVKPQRFLGSAIAELTTLAVPGHEDARLELYLVAPDDERKGRVQLSCGGTTVLDDLAFVDGAEHPRAPWDSGRFEGVVDFPELDVAPGTRRDFQRDLAALAFLDALPQVEMQLMALLREDEVARAEQDQKSVAREIRRLFRNVAFQLPEYELFDVRGRGAGPGAAAGEGSSAGDGSGASADGVAPPSDGALAPAGTGEEVRTPETGVVENAEPSARAEEAEEPSLFPPGPLARVRVTPPRLRIAPLAQRTLHAQALDVDGRRAEPPIEWKWTLDGLGTLTSSGADARFAAADEPGAARIVVRAEQGRHVAEAAVEVQVLAELAAQERASGIPEPTAVHASGERWRSRIKDGRWEYNAGHKDFVAVEATEARRVRYLAHLFAKEIVLRNFGQPEHAEVLERLVQVLTHMEDGRGGAGRRATSA